MPKKKSDYEVSDYVEENDLDEIIVFTDGSCSANGKNNSLGGIGIHFPHGELKDVSKIFKESFCTNQKTELYAILLAIKYVKSAYNLSKIHLIIKTDSMYSINCITKWIKFWLNNGWMTSSKKPVSNKKYIEKIHYYYEKYNITFQHVEAHTDLNSFDANGNRQADKLATNATKRAHINRSNNQTHSKNTSTKSSSNHNISGSKVSKKSTKSAKSTTPIKSSAKFSLKKTSLIPRPGAKNQDEYLKGNFVVELVKK